MSAGRSTRIRPPTLRAGTGRFERHGPAGSLAITGGQVLWAGLTLAQAFLMASLASCGFALADLVCGNIDRLRQAIRAGQLDAVLVRPLGVLLQLMATDFAPRRIGRVV